MAPMNKPSNIAEQSVADFYDALAEDYDLMTDFAGRFVRERPYFHMLIDKHNVRTALDAGCGTGFHSLLLSQLGVTVTAVDASQKMVKRLQQHSDEMELKVKALVATFEDLPDVVMEKFNMILCMGNSLAHTLTEQKMLAVLRNFRDLLKQDGILLFQNLNYDRILSQQEHIQSRKVTTSKTFVRSYEYRERRILFNVQTLENSTAVTNGKLQTIPLRPWLREELAGLLEKAGFEKVHFYGSITLQDFKPEGSKDLVILAQNGL